jgi:hypothetical protein
LPLPQVVDSFWAVHAVLGTHALLLHEQVTLPVQPKRPTQSALAVQACGLASKQESVIPLHWIELHESTGLVGPRGHWSPLLHVVDAGCWQAPARHTSPGSQSHFVAHWLAPAWQVPATHRSPAVGHTLPGRQPKLHSLLASQ